MSSKHSTVKCILIARDGFSKNEIVPYPAPPCLYLHTNPRMSPIGTITDHFMPPEDGDFKTRTFYLQTRSAEETICMYMEM